MSRHFPGQTISIGSPVPNTNVYILDENENPLPIGSIGVMWAGGLCVSRGYLNLPEKTTERYRVDKFVDDGYVNVFFFFIPSRQIVCIQKPLISGILAMKRISRAMYYP